MLICFRMGAGDYPEDVLGGLNRTLSLNWPASTAAKIVLHFGDAPPHGKRYVLCRHCCHGGRLHTVAPPLLPLLVIDDRFGDGYGDSLPDGHERDPDLAYLFSSFSRKGIEYQFMRLDSSCDRMLEVFAKYLGHAVEAHRLEAPTGSYCVLRVGVNASTAAVHKHKYAWCVCAAVLASTVIDSVSASLKRKTTTAVSGSGRDREFVIYERIPDYSRIAPVLVDVVTMELPEIKDIIEGA